MPPFIPVGLAAGLATALLFASASAGGVTGRIILFFLAPLPSYLAGLGWGYASAAVAAVTSAVITTGVLGPRTAAVFFLSQGLPLIALTYLVQLNREVAPPSAPGQPAVLEWYPIGRVLAAASLLAGALAFVSLVLLGGDVAQLRTMMRELLDEVFLKQLPSLGGEKLGEPEKEALTNLLLYALPAGSAILWLGGFLVNLWLSARITQMSGRLQRPWPDLGLTRLPPGYGFGLAGALAASLLGDLPGLAATGFAGAFLFAYLLIGLAIIHYRTRGMAARPIILSALYVTLLLFNTWAGLIIALVAILEPVMWYRRPDPNAPPPSPSPPAG